MSRAYYNEHDPKAAAWLRELIRQGHIAPGDVDERSIEDVVPTELARYTQCHFFAGIGVWSYALRRAGWPDDRPVWTGSCPCQPFSAAGKGAGFADERHLWPAFFHLIEQCQPRVVFGEQVASKDGLGWLDLVHADLEAAGYAIGAVDLCAAGVGAPHIRQRLWFVGVADAEGAGSGTGLRNSEPTRERGLFAGNVRTDGVMADVFGAGLEGHGRGPAAASGRDGTLRSVAESSESERMADDHGSRFQLEHARGARPCPTNGYWGTADWLYCRDGKWRPVESSILGVADGAAGSMVPSGLIVPASHPLAEKQDRRAMRLRGYGNAIVAPVAEAVIRSFLETEA